MEFVVYKSDITKINDIAKVFSSSKRLEIYLALVNKKLSVNEIAKLVCITPATTSVHVAILEKNGLIITEYEKNKSSISKLCSAKFEKISFNMANIKKAKVPV